MLIKKILVELVLTFMKLVSLRLIWLGLSRDLGLWAKSYLCCQWSKILSHVHASVPVIPVPLRCCSHVHLNLVGPLDMVSPTSSPILIAQPSPLSQSFPLYLGFEIGDSFCPHVRQWGPVHLLRLDRGMPFPGDFSVNNYKF